MIYDKNFLKYLDEKQYKEIFAKIVLLSIDEEPILEFQGSITSGSINIDGASAVRRTCSLSAVVTEEFESLTYVEMLKKKFKLDIGLKDGQIITWFPQGIFVCTSWNITHNLNSLNISLQGQDKMCLLNGTIQGSLPSSIDFGNIEDVNYEYTVVTDDEDYVQNFFYLKDEEGLYHLCKLPTRPAQPIYRKGRPITTITKIPIKHIIKNAVNVYGNERQENIIINDIDDFGYELMEYRGDEYLYILINSESKIASNIVFGNTRVYLTNTKKNVKIDNSESESKNDYIHYYTNAMQQIYSPEGLEYTEVQLDESVDAEKYYVYRVGYGDTAGYRITDLTYAGDLIANVGDSLTSVLDKIVQMLGNFEYFYNLEGKFVFQKKRTYVDTNWSPVEDGYIRNLYEDDSIAYFFEGSNLITTFQNSPNLTNLKNDYAVWGEKESVSGEKLPIHMRYAIDKKPTHYRAFDGNFYLTDSSVLESFKEEIKQSLLEEIYERIKSFKPQYSVPVELQTPVRQEDGSWSPGWWDIRDWAEYYEALTREKPIYTMRWYSQNDLSGCVYTGDMPRLNGVSTNSYVWLLIYDPDTGRYNAQHGSGNPHDGKVDLEIKYESYYNENNVLQTTVVVPEERKEFISPYRGCSNNHTYLVFLENDIKRDGNLVYFYNPNFPGMDDLSFEEIVKAQVEKEFKEYIKSGIFKWVDWREVIYQMALDFYKHNTEDDFYLQVAENNSQYPTGKTGYENYYADLQGFWRLLYNPTPDPEKVDREKELEFWGNPDKEEEAPYVSSGEDGDYWNIEVRRSPHSLLFWFDFFEGYDLNNYAVYNIGARTKAVTDNQVKAIYFKDTPTVLFFTPGQIDVLAKKSALPSGYSYINLPIIYENLFTISAQGKSAKNEIDNMLYNYGYCSESISLSAVPIYYLEPNTRIQVRDEKTGIDGEYLVNKITIPLNHNAVMQIQATKAPERIL